MNLDLEAKIYWTFYSFTRDVILKGKREHCPRIFNPSKGSFDCLSPLYAPSVHWPCLLKSLVPKFSSRAPLLPPHLIIMVAIWAAPLPPSRAVSQDLVFFGWAEWWVLSFFSLSLSASFWCSDWIVLRRNLLSKLKLRPFEKFKILSSIVSFHVQFPLLQQQKQLIDSTSFYKSDTKQAQM